jgi:hypothetical protein
MNDTPTTNIATLTALRTRWSLALFLVAAFVFRLAFGLLNKYWEADEIQIQLIGLKFFTTGAWPYFGPDVTHTQTQIPGALQGLLVGGPLYLLPIPEAPFVLVNLLSMASLSLLAWYILVQVPSLPRWFVWSWVFTAPWTLHYGAHVLNTDYVMTGAILFWVGMWEMTPGLRQDVIPRFLAGMMMGFGLLWIFQLHLSWPVLLPFIGFAAWSAVRESPRTLARWGGGLLLGAATIGALLVPTIVVYGLGGGTGGTESNLVFAGWNPLELFATIVARFFSFASYELAYWLGGSTADRLALVGRHPWVIQFAAFLFLVGYLHPLVLAVEFFRSKSQATWRTVRHLVGALLLILFVAYNFSVAGPHSHTFYLTMPVAMLYSMYCWAPWLERQTWRRFAALVIFSGLVVSASFMADYGPLRSLYSDRARVIRAIQQSDYHIVGERRSTEWGCCY